MSRDPAYVLDVLNAARRARRHVEGMTKEHLAAAPVHQDAVLYALGVMGEAAKRISEECRAAHPEVPWKEMARFRDRIIHHYDRVDWEIVWKVLQEDLPPVIASLERIVPQEGTA